MRLHVLLLYKQEAKGIQAVPSCAGDIIWSQRRISSVQKAEQATMTSQSLVMASNNSLKPKLSEHLTC